MTSKNIAIENILEKFSDIIGKEGVALISSEGLVIASKFDAEHHAHRLEEKIAVVATAANDMAIKEGFSDFDQVQFESKNRKILIQKNQRAGFFIILAGKETMNIGLAKLTLKEVMQELEEVFKIEERTPSMG